MALRKRGTSWQIDYIDPEGKRVRQSFKKKKDAQAEHDKRRTLIREDRYLDVKQRSFHTLGELVAAYRDRYRNQPSYEHKGTYLTNFEEYFGSETLVDSITYQRLHDYKAYLLNKPTPQGEVRKPSSVNRELACLNHLLNLGVSRGMLQKNPFTENRGKRGIDSLWQKEEPRIRYLEQHEILRLLDSIEHQWFRDLVAFTLHTGLRRKELLNLTWKHIKDGIIYVKDFKTNSTREVPIDDGLHEILSGMKRRNRLGPGNVKPENIFVDHRSKAVTLVQVKWYFKKAMDAAGLNDFHFHDLRHSFAAHFMMRGGNIYTLQAYMGHDSIKYTQRYAHLSPQYKKEAIAIMADLTERKPLQAVAEGK
ncbi:MAG TPA: site-specific integrase [Desulfatiglandales bacterium]|nr:site-specific integrase [Desulfatiglandales bacterium]